jgi:hypothetical protein
VKTFMFLSLAFVLAASVAVISKTSSPESGQTRPIVSHLY